MCLVDQKLDPTAFYKCLADDTRLRCLLLIEQEQELCVCELTQALNLSQPKISRHLAQLRQFGILQDTRRAKWVFYGIHPQLADWAKTVLVQTLRANSDMLAENNQQLNLMGDRPSRLQQCCN